MAYSMVAVYGMNSELGLLSYGQNLGSPVVPFGPFSFLGSFKTLLKLKPNSRRKGTLSI